MRTELDFEGQDADLGEESVAVTGDLFVGRRGALRASLGAVVDGRLTVEGRQFDIHPGFLAGLGGSWTAVPEQGLAPFLALSGSLSLLATTTEPDTGLQALDARIVVLVGKTLWQVLRPALFARAFAGPVFWSIDGQDVSGGDQHHFGVGLALSLVLPGGFDVQAEGSALGERSVALAVGASF